MNIINAFILNFRSTFYGDLLQFNLSKTSWKELCPQLDRFSPKANHSAIAVGGKLWVVGGSNNDCVCSDVGFLDLKTLTWETPAIK